MHKKSKTERDIFVLLPKTSPSLFQSWKESFIASIKSFNTIFLQQIWQIDFNPALSCKALAPHSTSVSHVCV